MSIDTLLPLPITTTANPEAKISPFLGHKLSRYGVYRLSRFYISIYVNN